MSVRHLRQLISRKLFFSKSIVLLNHQSITVCNSAKCILIRLEARLQPNIGFTLLRPSEGVHAFGCNATESEPIWMKCGAL